VPAVATVAMPTTTNYNMIDQSHYNRQNQSLQEAKQNERKEKTDLFIQKELS
jgi:tRNA A37 threonylcarbamoyladenosine synthetase subunit TsaC/SUA5/YrdC